MDSRILQEAALSYLAVYDEELREEMEDCGMILAEDYYPVYEDRSGYGPDEKFRTPEDRIKRPGTDVPPVKVGRYDTPISRYSPMGGRKSRTSSEVTDIIKGKAVNTPQAKSLPRENPGKPKMVKVGGKWQKQMESFDFYDVVLHHLISEGYADSVDSAEVIMANMSEDWISDIVGEILDEDSRRVSNRQHAERVRGNIRSFSGSKSIDYTPPSNWDPEANRGKGAVLTRKQIEKQRRKHLKNSN